MVGVRRNSSRSACVSPVRWIPRSLLMVRRSASPIGSAHWWLRRVICPPVGKIAFYDAESHGGRDGRLRPGSARC